MNVNRDFSNVFLLFKPDLSLEEAQVYSTTCNRMLSRQESWTNDKFRIRTVNTVTLIWFSKLWVSTPEGGGENLLNHAWLIEPNHRALVRVKEKESREGDPVEADTETEILRSVQGHPNIIKLYESKQLHKEGLTTRVMLVEWHGRGNLSSYIHGNLDNSYPIESEWAMQLLRVVKYLHDRGIVHSDIKPANILLSDNDNIILIDFGYAYRAAPNLSFSRGTPVYAAPEVLFHPCVAGPHTDVWSVAVTIHFLLHKARLPHQYYVLNNKAHEKQTFRDLAVDPFQGNLTTASKIAINHLLEYDYEKRPALTDQVLAQFEQALYPAKSQ